MRQVDLSNFNLNLLVALDGLLSQRSVTAAAKRVRVTPSAMSHSLSELRHLLGDPLLVRSGRGMVLTPRAEALVSPLHTLLMDAERLLGGGAPEPRSALVAQGFSVRSGPSGVHAALRGESAHQRLKAGIDLGAVLEAAVRLAASQGGRPPDPSEPA